MSAALGLGAFAAMCMCFGLSAAVVIDDSDDDPYRDPSFREDLVRWIASIVLAFAGMGFFWSAIAMLRAAVS